jgi:hypothetical protein
MGSLHGLKWAHFKRTAVLGSGVTGIGAHDSKVALYEDAEGDRGIIAVEVRTQQQPRSSSSSSSNQPCVIPTALQSMVLCRSLLRWPACTARTHQVKQQQLQQQVPGLASCSITQLCSVAL